MDTIYKGDLSTKAGRRNAWIDALFVDHAVLRILWTNFAVVKPAVLYRSNHPTPGNLAAFKRKATTAPRSGKKKTSTKASKTARPGIRVLEISALEATGLEKLKLELHKALT